MPVERADEKLSDLERVNVIVEYFKKFIQNYYKNSEKTNYNQLFSDYTKEFDKQGISLRTVQKWRSWNADKNLKGPSKDILNSVFDLAPWIWTEDFSSMIEMTKRMPEFIDVNPREDIDSFVYLDENIDELTIQERELINNLSKMDTIDLTSIELNKHSPSFLHQLALKLKSKKQMREVLSVIEHIFASTSNYKYAHYNELELLQAVCYSHDSIKDWDSAIEILRKLYGIGYHHTNLEVSTLLASNYKRKALTDKNGNWCNIEDIDKKLLSYSLTLYQKTMKMRKKIEKYYDAINIFYLIKIFMKIDADYTKESVKEIIEEIEHVYHQSSFNINKWWEISTKAEFLMLKGEVEEAIAEFNAHLELEKNEAFNIDTTIRQIDMYVHFTNDAKAKKVLDYLNDVKKDIIFV